MSSPISAVKNAHLCVLIHGLWGNPGHLKYLKNAFRKKFEGVEELRLLVAKSNSGNFTYDGIEIGAERVTYEIEEEVSRLSQTGIKIDRLSIVGYSLGGVVGRFAAGLLYHKGYFDKIKPISFTTFATPHLGVRTPLTGFGNHIWNVLGARTLSVTGRQLFLVDQFRDTGRPLLSVMCDKDSVFMKALAAFETRTLYSNIINDRSAVYYTTSISAIDPFTNLNAVEINYLDECNPILVDHNNPVSPKPTKPKLNNWLAAIDFSSLWLRVRLGLLFTLIIPIGGFLYLANAAVQAVLSGHRIKAHAAGIHSRSYDLPLMVDKVRTTMESIRDRAEEAFEHANNEHEQQYLHEDVERRASMDAGEITDTSDISEFMKIGSMEFPTLALTQSQFGMIKSLDDVGWTKYPVHIHKATHSHAAIIVRMNRDSFAEGKRVISHFLDKFQV